MSKFKFQTRQEQTKKVPRFQILASSEDAWIRWLIAMGVTHAGQRLASDTRLRIKFSASRLDRLIVVATSEAGVIVDHDQKPKWKHNQLHIHDNGKHKMQFIECSLFSPIITSLFDILQLWWSIESKFSQVCYFMHVGIHQVRILVCRSKSTQTFKALETWVIKKT